MTVLRFESTKSICINARMRMKLHGYDYIVEIFFSLRVLNVSHSKAPTNFLGM